MVFYLQTLQFNNVMLEQTLAAVPLFVFMGIMMEQAGLMERLFTSVQLMLSRTRGALYLAVLFVSTISQLLPVSLELQSRSWVLWQLKR